jgi:hypothetical protein
VSFGEFFRVYSFGVINIMQNSRSGLFDYDLLICLVLSLYFPTSSQPRNLKDFQELKIKPLRILHSSEKARIAECREIGEGLNNISKK